MHWSVRSAETRRSCQSTPSNYSEDSKRTDRRHERRLISPLNQKGDMAPAMASHRSSSHPRGAANVWTPSRRILTGDHFRQPITGAPGGTQHVHTGYPRRHPLPQDLSSLSTLCCSAHTDRTMTTLGYFSSSSVTSRQHGPGLGLPSIKRLLVIAHYQNVFVLTGRFIQARAYSLIRSGVASASLLHGGGAHLSLSNKERTPPRGLLRISTMTLAHDGAVLATKSKPPGCCVSFPSSYPASRPGCVHQVSESARVAPLRPQTPLLFPALRRTKRGMGSVLSCATRGRGRS
ncbi:hypothetical protein QBC39DRAFT_134831 [Podospora conica]|nr:hypothetical protein QBC39DRAFT_134831 [Schizothecium conicum]